MVSHRKLERKIAERDWNKAAGNAMIPVGLLLGIGTIITTLICRFQFEIDIERTVVLLGTLSMYALICIFNAIRLYARYDVLREFPSARKELAANVGYRRPLRIVLRVESILVYTRRTIQSHMRKF